MDMYQRYSRNLPALSRQEQELLHKKRVLVAGCGGLGGYITENLLRLGIGHITAVDGDSFDVSNLNRQLLATEATIGKSKAEAAKERATLVNPSVEFMAIGKYITPENAADTIAGHNIVIDALDSVSARLLLEDACAQGGYTARSTAQYAAGAVSMAFPCPAAACCTGYIQTPYYNERRRTALCSAILRSAAMRCGGKAPHGKADIRRQALYVRPPLDGVQRYRPLGLLTHFYYTAAARTRQYISCPIPSFLQHPHIIISKSDSIIYTNSGKRLSSLSAVCPSNLLISLKNPFPAVFLLQYGSKKVMLKKRR